MNSNFNSGVSPCKEKFCSIVTDIFDKCKTMIVEKDDTLEYDAVELTLLLKSIGFRLFSLEFNEPPNDKVNDIEIEIRCKKSGLNSKLILKNDKCSCPLRKAANNNSFWEIQGIAPSTPDMKSKGLVQDTSCSLLPDISKKSEKFAKTMLAVLLQNYQMDYGLKGQSEEINTKMLDFKQILERFQPKAENTLKPQVSPADKPNVEITKNSHCSTPLSSINVTPTPSYDGSMENTTPQVFITSYENGTIGNPKQLRDNSSDIYQSLPISESESLKTNDKTYDKFSSIESEKESLKKEIQEACKHLDSALTILKINPTKDLSNNNTTMSSILESVPQKKPLSSLLTRNRPLLGLSGTAKNSSPSTVLGNRRHSTGSRSDIKNETINRKNITNQKLNTSNTQFKRRSIGTPSSSGLSSLTRLESKSGQNTPKSNITETNKKLANKYLDSNYVKPIIKRSSTGSSLKSNLIKTPSTRSVNKYNTLEKISKNDK